MAANAEVEMQAPPQDGVQDIDDNDNSIEQEEDYDDQEGDPLTTYGKEDALVLSENSKSGSDSDDNSDDDAMTKFLDGDRPTGAEGQSQNVPKKVVINPWCISTSILLLILCISILMTMFAPKLFESLIQNMLHYMVDDNMHNEGKGGFEITNLFMMFFAIFNTAVFAMCGNIDYLLMVSCGYLYGDDQHEWLTGGIVYLISNYIGCAVAFAIGRALFKDRLYFIFSKHEKYRYFQRVFTDHSLLLSMTFNLNPFLPSGLIAYGLSISSMTWRLFLIGHASRIPNIAIMSYAGYIIRRYAENDPIENTNIDMITIKNAYKSNDITYGFTVTFCVIFAILLLVTTFAMYLQYQRLVLGDALRKAEEERSETEEERSDSRWTSNENEDDDEQDGDERSSSSESEDTFDEYGGLNDKKQKFLFQDDFGGGDNTTQDGPIQDNSASDENGVKTGYGSEDISNNGTSSIQMQPLKKKKSKRKTRPKKERERLYSEDRPRKEKRSRDKTKKNKNKRFNNNIWNTIVLATSPTEKDNTMLFEEGPRYGSQEDNYMGKQQRSGTGSIAINMNGAGGKKDGNKNGKGNKKNSDAKSPRSPSSKKIDFGKFNFLKKSNKDNNDNKDNNNGGNGQNGDASSPRASNNP